MRRCFWTLLSLAFLALACDEPPVVAWRTPAAAAQLTWMPLDLVFDFQAQNAIAGTLHVTLNGNDVSGLFTLDAPLNGRITAHAADVWGPGFVAPGANVLRAEITYTANGFSQVYAHEISVTTLGDPYADAVSAFAPGAAAGFGQSGLPGKVLGPPLGGGAFGGGLDVVSLGVSGSIDLAFTNNVIVNGPGPDFTVFENPFLQIGAFSLTSPPFAEPGRVKVSQNGVTWFTFPCAMTSPPYFAGCAGVYPVLSNANNAGAPHASVLTTTPIQNLVGVSSLGFVLPAGAGGDSFDLAAVGLAWVRYVRIEASPTATGPEGTDNARFDLDAVSAVNAVPATDANGNGIPDAVE
jgi:hypothetical protein